MPFRKKIKVPQREPILTPEETAEFRKYDYPFENIAMEGGGCKGSAYVGAFRMLEEAGILQNIKRFSGASAGAMGAMWASLGYDSYDIEKFVNVDQEYKTFDAKFGKASLLLNMKNNLGWHPGNRLLRWLKKSVAKKLGDPNATFADLYNKTGRELCIVVVNVNQLDCQYCHVKTTPTMPIAVAVRMSASIPGVLAPVKYRLHDKEELFCDGGLICNYPIHVFDGWYLSMDPKDSFLRRMPDLRDVTVAWDNSFKFGTEPNKKTIGVLLFSEVEEEMFKVQLIERTENYTEPVNLPNTLMARQYLRSKEVKSAVAVTHDTLFEAMSDFLILLKENDVDDSGTISREELKKAIEKAGDKFTKEQQEELFGKGVSLDDLFDAIDVDGDGEITTAELTHFAEMKGLKIRKMIRGFESRKIKTISSYLDAIMETMLLNLKKLFMRGDDLNRTIGINTQYIETLDFRMEKGDKQFLQEQGKVACMAFLRSHLAEHELAEKTRGDVCHEQPANGQQVKKRFVPSKKYYSFRKKSRKSSTNKINMKDRPKTLPANSKLPLVKPTEKRQAVTAVSVPNENSTSEVTSGAAATNGNHTGQICENGAVAKTNGTLESGQMKNQQNNETSSSSAIADH